MSQLHDVPIQGVLFTVGGTIDPVCFTLEQVRPGTVAFVCSEETKKQVSEVEEMMRTAGVTFEGRTFIARDPDNLAGCVSTCQNALAWLLNEKKLEKKSVRVDYTGGKKNMSAAAVLAATPDGITFLYVAGESNKGGAGTVKPGKEKLVRNANPWDLLGTENIRRALAFADLGQFMAAIEMVKNQRERSTAALAQRLEMLVGLLNGLAAWDAFDHKKALGCWNSGKLTSELELAAKHAEDALLQKASEAVKKALPGINALIQAADKPPKLGVADPVLLDLLANADRRLRFGQVDFAVQLYYRVLELDAARRLKRQPHCLDNSRVPMDKIPEPLRTQWKSRSFDGKHISLGLNNTYELLEKLGDAAGKSYVAEVENWMQWAAMRNKSWLVHDLGHADESTVRKLRERVMLFLGFTEGDLPAWPRLLQ